MTPPENSIESIAIVGMAGRFPGARNIAEFWTNLRDGVESIAHFTDDELQVPVEKGHYVKARSILDDADLFDASFFGIYPKEAELIDPQHRVFLECCAEALDHAGYDPSTYPGAIGVYAGCSMNTYFLQSICAGRGEIEDFTRGYQIANYPMLMGASRDFLATRVSYKLNLRGPSFTLQAGCSTSLLAVCQACQSLLAYQCDMALAGGVSITFPQKRGYAYQEGGMASPDGHCRTFDENAQGTVFGSGAGVVLLKRLSDALDYGDHILAVIKGFATNNDGSNKVGYTAPSVEGQAQVVAMAHALAGVESDSISYVEAHGTGTPLGDPIEIAALTKAFGAGTQRKNFCAIGTAKTNVGHLDVAAGVTGLIKTVLSLRNKQIPPLLNFKRPNPKLELENSPFYATAELTEWKNGRYPRRAGVSAFGVGGTNAHVIVEEAPQAPASQSTRPAHLLLLSAKTESALTTSVRNLAEHLTREPDANLADVAYTLGVGRRAFEHRRAVVCRDRSDALQALLEDGSKPGEGSRTRPRPVVFLFPGQGAQYAKMGRALYDSEPRFRGHLDSCFDLLAPELKLRDVLFGGTEETLTQTAVAQPALFSMGYALARLWMEWGVEAQTLLGHSVGEFVAACLCGVFSLEDALRLVAARGRLMQDLPAGAMLSARLSEQDAQSFLNADIQLAAVNGPALCVLAGPVSAIESVEKRLRERNVAARRLKTSHAFHSAMLDPIVEPLRKIAAGIRLSAPEKPFVSSVTGTWIGASNATDPLYWARHSRETVRFSAAIQTLLGGEERLYLEAGSGNILSTLTLQHCRGKDSKPVVISSLPVFESDEAPAEYRLLLEALGKIWTAGIQPDWAAFYSGESRHRVPLPSYPFERKRYWIDPPQCNTPPLQASYERNAPMQPAAPTPVSIPQRRDRIQSAVRMLVEELSGNKIQDGAASTSFLELGYDSLFLTQVASALQDKFGLKVTFRQLLDQQSSLAALAEYLDQNLPADALSAEPAPAAPVQPLPPAPQLDTQWMNENPSASAAVIANGNGHVAPILAAPATTLERVVQDQLQAMSQLMGRQLDMLRGAAGEAQPAQVPPPARADTPPRAAASAPTPVITPAEHHEIKPYGPYKPVQKGPTGGLTEQQEKYLNALISRYTKKTAQSKALTQKYRQVLADPRVVAGFRSQWKQMVYPIVTERSKGSKLWDADGNEYVDILNAFGPIMLGHSPDFIVEALEKQLKEGFEIGPQTILAGKVAELICELTGMERASFCNTGSEAVMAAMRVARTVTGRKKVVFFTGDYHGQFDEVLSKAIRKNGEPAAAPVAPGIPTEKSENVVVLDYGTAETVEWIRKHARELAAVLVEPVQSRHPNLQPREFLHELRRITEQSGTALIFDEVVTGFRVHPGGVQALFGIRADIATYGKVLGGGMPIGVIAGKARFLDALDGGMWNYDDDSFPEAGVTFFAGTFVRHPLTLAAVYAVLNHLKKEGPALQARLSERTGKLVQRINTFLEEQRVPLRVENFASVFYFSFPSDLRFGTLFYYHMRERGVHVLEGFPCFLTTQHSDADIEKVYQAFTGSILEMKAGGVLPLTEGSGGGNGSHAPPPAAEAKAGPEKKMNSDAPLTESQMEIFLSCQLGPEASCAYNESLTLHLRGCLDPNALALQEVVDRHEALRSSFSPGGDLIKVSPALRVETPFHDLSSLENSARETEFKKLLREEAFTSFSLSEGPLFRFHLVKLGADHHALVFTAHHIVCDGWSMNVILDELARLYTARVTGAGCQLPEPLDFSVYAWRQHEHFGSAEGARIEEYWAKQFEFLPPQLNLPTDRPRPALSSFNGATYRTKIGGETLKRIKKASAQQRCTLFATLLAGFEVLLGRLSGQDDIVVGVPTAGQSLLDGQTLVGHCVNFLPIRGKVSGDSTLADFLARMKRALLDAYEHQNYTYGKLVRRLNVPRDPARLPLMEVQFNLERIGTGANFAGLKAESDPNPKAFVNFDLFLNIVESDDWLTLDCDYNTELFDEQTVARWLKHYETLLEGLAVDPSQSIARVPLLTPAQRRELLLNCNNTHRKFAQEKCVHHLIEDQAALTPDSVAASCAGVSLTYAELNARANQLANYLSKCGVGPDVPVAICIDRSLEMLVGLLGILKAGGAYVPLDPAYPKERLEYILENAGAAVLLTQENLKAGLNPHRARVINLDLEAGMIAAESTLRVPAREMRNKAVTSENLAYIIYTSGSTGKPKGVEIRHRSVTNLLSSMLREPGMSSDDVLLAVITLSFDMAVPELFLPLCAGAKLVIATRETVSDGKLLLKQIADDGITILEATPATWRILVEAGWKQTPGLKMLCGGEALPRDLANQMLQRGEALWNVYGPTETTVFSSVTPIESGNGPVCIGPPLANTQFHVLDNLRQPVPIGVVGELYIGGEGLARGYRGLPELSAEKFIRDPFRSDPGARLFKTGDLVRHLGGGKLEFLGRSDHQVKIRGFRIELDETETVLRQHPEVGEAVVSARQNGSGEKTLAAYVVARPGNDPASEREKEWHAGQLAQWQMQYSKAVDESGGKSPAYDASLNIYGWQGLSNTDAEVKRWIERTAERILKLKPSRILEIGCGTGLLLSALAPHCKFYHGTDLSAAALEHLKKRVASAGRELSHVSLSQRMADKFDGIEKGAYDAVVLNSVVEYFPSADYLARVVRGALQVLAPDGFIFFGDVPNMVLRECFHAADQLHHATETLSVSQLKANVLRKIAQENRLVVAPSFFDALRREFPRITHVEIKPERGPFQNEATRIHADSHYDAILRTAAISAVLPQVWRDWQKESLNLELVRTELDTRRPQALALSRVPIARLKGARKVFEMLSTATGSAVKLRQEAIPYFSGMDVEALWSLGETHPYSVHMRWSQQDPACCDVVLARSENGILPEFPADESSGSLAAQTNDPLQEIAARNLPQRLRSFLHEKLPEYMVPPAVVVLDCLPRTANGKIDRNALPAPEFDAQATEDSVLPRTPAEQALERIWAQVLGRERIGVLENIFEIGGDSLLIFQIATRAQQSGIALSPKIVFQHRTIAACAAACENHGKSAHEAELKRKIDTMSPEQIRALLHVKRGSLEKEKV